MDERRQRLIDHAKNLNPPDRLAIAVLEGGRTWTPAPEAPPMLRIIWAGLRWSRAA